MSAWTFGIDAHRGQFHVPCFRVSCYGFEIDLDRLEHLLWAHATPIGLQFWGFGLRFWFWFPPSGFWFTVYGFGFRAKDLDGCEHGLLGVDAHRRRHVRLEVLPALVESNFFPGNLNLGFRSKPESREAKGGGIPWRWITFFSHFWRKPELPGLLKSRVWCLEEKTCTRNEPTKCSKAPLALTPNPQTLDAFMSV